MCEYQETYGEFFLSSSGWARPDHQVDEVYTIFVYGPNGKHFFTAKCNLSGIRKALNYGENIEGNDKRILIEDTKRKIDRCDFSDLEITYG
jgi:hypothetical protein